MDLDAATDKGDQHRRGPAQWTAYCAHRLARLERVQSLVGLITADGYANEQARTIVTAAVRATRRREFVLLAVGTLMLCLGVLMVVPLVGGILLVTRSVLVLARARLPNQPRGTAT